MSAVTASRRVGPLDTARHTMTLAWRGLVQIKHNPMELLDLSVQPIMFVLLFTYVFGGAIAGSPGEFLQWALPGIIVQNALFATLATAVGLNVDVEKGVFDRLRSLPIARTAPLTGRVLADLAKQVWSLALVLAIGLALGFRIQTGIGGVLASAALLIVVALAMSWMSVLIGLAASSVEKVQIFAFSLMLPLTFTSSAFVDIRTMPGPLATWAEVNPVTYLSDAIRGLLLGGPVAAPATRALLWSAAIAVVCAPLAVRAFRRRA
ncbi:ABC transporter permease [Bailinhaonella thermotolerans]|uniref:Transport permease protein n=1 Tax=Bailinhaonella thermotolerans TaxID=1070861 RepID=A0A3A4B095_9ACTN|nr:ABC transporter permease [Bailinhaonella thermotolerans]RJL34269.1 ABC transporter permease [Bailinhaonella thermotolerans]